MTNELGAMSRRGVLGLSAAVGLAPSLAGASTASPVGADLQSYASLLKIWCDGLLGQQVSGLVWQNANGGFLCPGCGMIHGRIADTVYPLMRMARTSGDPRYVQAAKAAQDWSERNVSRPDGGWVNDVFLNDWKGTSVFRATALAETLLHHGDLLDAQTRDAWRARLAAAYNFLTGYMKMDTGNINYPVSAAYAFSLGAEVFGRSDYETRARDFAHACLDYFTPNNLLFGEGHPQRGRSPKGRPPVDLGYNVEESLPALAMYALRTGDKAVLDQTVASLRAHMEFMLPDGGWDNSWGTRNFKWTWWGSRTSDGCHPAYRLLADHDPRFAEVAARNLAQLAACTHDGLLYGGPHYRDHGYRPCIHHTFSHAKALATVIDLAKPTPIAPAALPRDVAYGLKSFSEIGTHLASVGPWRATFTDYDFDYMAPAGGGHASGGALSLLYHQALGPVLTASMTRYKAVEITNQQAPIDATHQPLTPRIEVTQDKEAFTSLADLTAEMTVESDGQRVRVVSRGRLLTPEGKGLDPAVAYALIYDLTPEGLSVTARVSGLGEGRSARLIMPLIARRDEATSQPDARRFVVARKGGRILVKSADHDFEPLAVPRVFNLVPGFQAAPLAIALNDGQIARLEISAQT
ncbi:hypothetical protein [Caulobacter sp. 1776]|uniref:hypothetical protein n=1 Tax=Caulobacter sp. 1776 TaxID=3156420 RepID=UPI00339A904B